MPVKKAAKKALKQNLKRRKRNLLYKKKAKEIIKEIKKALLEEKRDRAKELLPQAYKVIDKMAKVGIIKKNTASRKKSRLSKLIKK